MRVSYQFHRTWRNEGWFPWMRKQWLMVGRLSSWQRLYQYPQNKIAKPFLAKTPIITWMTNHCQNEHHIDKGNHDLSRRNKEDEYGVEEITMVLKESLLLVGWESIEQRVRNRVKREPRVWVFGGEYVVGGK